MTSSIKSNLQLLSFVVITGLSLVLYWPILEHGFYYDDFRILKRIELVAQPWSSGNTSEALRSLANFPNPEFGYIRPVWGAITWLQWSLFGRNPVGYHAMSLILMLLNIALGFFLLQKLYGIGAVWGLFFLIWSPIAAHSVAWISQQSYLLAANLVFLAIILHITALSKPDHSFWASLAGSIVYGIGVLTHEAVLPLFIIALFLLFTARHLPNRRKITLLIPWLIMPVLVLGYRLLAGGSFKLSPNVGLINNLVVRYASTYLDLLVNAIVPLYAYRSANLLVSYIVVTIALMIALWGFSGFSAKKLLTASLQDDPPYLSPIALNWLGPVWLTIMTLILLPQGGLVRTLYISLIGVTLLVARLTQRLSIYSLKRQIVIYILIVLRP